MKSHCIDCGDHSCSKDNGCTLHPARASFEVLPTSASCRAAWYLRHVGCSQRTVEAMIMHSADKHRILCITMLMHYLAVWGACRPMQEGRGAQNPMQFAKYALPGHALSGLPLYKGECSNRHLLLLNAARYSTSSAQGRRDALREVSGSRIARS